MLEVVIEPQAIRVGQYFAVSFHRTLRIPDDGGPYPLPPGLGTFPLLRIDADTAPFPPAWRERGSACLAMYQREALWLGFHGVAWHPNAVKVGIGGMNALSGQPFDCVLEADPQDYLVVPEQPWLDGMKTGQGTVRQFVAMPLGLGYTVEAALTGQERYGGIEIAVFAPKPGRFPDTPPPAVEPGAGPMAMAGLQRGKAQSMGIGAGGVMQQQIYPDPYGLDVWDQDNYGCVPVHIFNSAQYREIMDEEQPPTPIDAATYNAHGLPWFDLYDEAQGDIAPSTRLAQAKTIAERDAERGLSPENQSAFEVPETQIERLPHRRVESARAQRWSEQRRRSDIDDVPEEETP
jgi:hypothetical protein